MQLRAIRLVPSIMKLQKLLIQKFQRKLDRGEALTTTIENMIEEYKNGNVFRIFLLATVCIFTFLYMFIIIFHFCFVFIKTIYLSFVEGRSEDMRSLVDDFILAWQFVKDKLFTYSMSKDHLLSCSLIPIY